MDLLHKRSFVRSKPSICITYLRQRSVEIETSRKYVHSVGRSGSGANTQPLKLKWEQLKKHVTNIFENKHLKIRKDKVQKVTFKSVKTIKCSLIIIRKKSDNVKVSIKSYRTRKHLSNVIAFIKDIEKLSKEVWKND